MNHYIAANTAIQALQLMPYLTNELVSELDNEDDIILVTQEEAKRITIHYSETEEMMSMQSFMDACAHPNHLVTVDEDLKGEMPKIVMEDEGYQTTQKSEGVSN